MATVKKNVLKKGAQSRARMVEAAANLLQRKGYNGTGLSQIIKESGTPKGSLYFHFPGGKEQLTIAALTESGAGFGAKLRELISPKMAPGLAIEIACAALAEQLVASNYEEGCPLATVTLEAASSSEPIREACAQQFHDWQALIASMLIAADVPKARAEGLATTALSSIEGAMLLCRAYRSTTPLEQVGEQLRFVLSVVTDETYSPK